jgi:hypothetical protein
LQRYTETSTGHCIKESKGRREGDVREEEGAELAGDGAADVGGVGGVHVHRQLGLGLPDRLHRSGGVINLNLRRRGVWKRRRMNERKEATELLLVQPTRKRWLLGDATDSAGGGASRRSGAACGPTRVRKKEERGCREGSAGG